MGEQGLAEAERTYETMAEVYTELGYQILDLPRADVATRVEFVAERICSPSGSTDRRAIEDPAKCCDRAP